MTAKFGTAGNSGAGRRRVFKDLRRNREWRRNLELRAIRRGQVGNRASSFTDTDVSRFTGVAGRRRVFKDLRRNREWRRNLELRAIRGGGVVGTGRPVSRILMSVVSRGSPGWRGGLKTCDIIVLLCRNLQLRFFGGEVFLLPEQ